MNQTVARASAADEKDQLQLMEYAVGDLKFNLVRHIVYCNGATLQMSGKNFLLLHTLAFKIHKGGDPVADRDELRWVLYGDDPGIYPASNTIDVFVNRVRARLKACRSAWKIQTVRSRGYQLELVNSNQNAPPT